MKLSLKKSTTSKLIHTFCRDSSSSTGAGLTGLTSASSGLTAFYIREGDSSATQIVLSGGTLGTWSSGGFIVCDGTNLPGLYEVGVPNAAFTSGNSVKIMLKGATNLAPVLVEIELTGWDNQDATRGGMSALPNVAAAGNGGLPTVDGNNAVKLQSGSGANQILLSSGAVTVGTNNDKTGYSLASLDSSIQHSGTAQAGAAGSITLAAGASATDNLYNGQTVKIYSATGAGQTRVITAYVGSTKVATVDRNWITNPDSTSLYGVLASSNPKIDSSFQVTAASVQGNVTGSVASVTAGVTVSTNNDKTGYALTAGEHTSITADIWDSSRASHTTAGTFGQGVASVQGNVTGSVASVTAGVTVSTNNDKTGYSLASLDSFIQQSGTAQAGAAGSITLAAGASATDNLYNGQVIKVYSATGAGQARVITGYTGSTKIATVDRNWITNPDSTSLYAVLGIEHAKIDSNLQVTAGSVQGNVTGSVASVTGAVGSVTGSVASVTAGVTVSTNNDKTGYALTSGERSSISTTVWSEALPGSYTSGQAGFKLNAAGSASDPWSTALPGSYGAGTAGDIIGNKIPGIKTVTDKFAFTTANQVDARVFTNSDKTGYALTAGEHTSIGTDVWEAVRASHTTAGTFGQGVASVQGNVTGSVNSVTSGVTVSTNSDKTGYALTAGERTSVADALLTRDMSAVSGEASKSPINALRKVRNKFTISGTTLTVFKEDGSTSAYTETLTVDAAGQPITGSSG